MSALVSVLLISLIVLLALFAKSYAGSNLKMKMSRRAKIKEIYTLDFKRRVVIVEIKNIEYTILYNQTNDILLNKSYNPARSQVINAIGTDMNAPKQGVFMALVSYAKYAFKAVLKPAWHITKRYLHSLHSYVAVTKNDDRSDNRNDNDNDMRAKTSTVESLGVAATDTIDAYTDTRSDANNIMWKAAMHTASGNKQGGEALDGGDGNDGSNNTDDDCNNANKKEGQ